MDHAIDTTPDEHAATFDIDGAHRIREQHDGENEPRCSFADGLFGNAADVISGGGQVTENDRGRPPERDERQHYGCCHNDLVSRTCRWLVVCPTHAALLTRGNNRIFGSIRACDFNELTIFVDFDHQGAIAFGFLEKYGNRG